MVRSPSVALDGIHLAQSFLWYFFFPRLNISGFFLRLKSAWVVGDGKEGGGGDS